jgi:SagB-type dehydrogenase family enzyme
MDRWTTWNPAAGFFHSATRDNLYIEPLAGDRLLRAKAKNVPVPACVKRYPRARSHALPRVRATGEFPQVLLTRRTWRQFSKRPVTIGALATLLGLTGGIHEWATVPGQADLPLKTSPSGGSRHPIEIYVYVRRVEGISAGLYHYAGDTHRLELLKARRGAATVRRYLPTQFWYEGAAAVVFFSALYERYQWKYSDARAYRATLIEAGHQCQTFCLVATWLGLAPFCTMALADSEIEDDLGLDGVSESVIYAAGVGVRPPGDKIRSKPEGFPQSRVRPNPRVVAP